MKRVILLLLRLYKTCLSPYLPRACRFSPTCSEYMQLAVLEHGVLRGCLMGAWRVARCHPMHPGGIDLP